LLPIPALRKVFRGKFTAGLKQLHRKGLLDCSGPAAGFQHPKQFARLLRTVHRNDWVVYAKQAMGGPAQVLRYLGRYTIASPSPTTACSASTANASLSDGRTMPTQQAAHHDA